MVRKLLLGLFSGFCSLLLLAGVGWMGLNWYASKNIIALEASEFTIEPGDSLGKVVTRLASQQLIEYPQLFEVLARIGGVASDLQAGDYLIPEGVSHRELLGIFVQGLVRYYSVTLVEGRTLKEALEVLNHHPKLTGPISFDQLPLEKEGVVETVEGIEGVEGLENLEGLFYPDTYNFEAGASVASVLKMAGRRLVSVLAEEWEKRLEDLPYQSPYEALIMASIIEKETGVPYERPDIAGVFVRRLNKGMRLQTDPTVIYGLGERFEGNLTRRMLRERTPYNTYVINGLPPTPIALVGREAIEAALHPASGNVFYFV
ncbi:MAG: endolytic transglycosylase MltG, partial [Endozoicomonas sp.]